jgi:hypothetical protein
MRNGKNFSGRNSIRSHINLRERQLHGMRRARRVFTLLNGRSPGSRRTKRLITLQLFPPSRLLASGWCSNAPWKKSRRPTVAGSAAVGMPVRVHAAAFPLGP